VTYAGSVTTVVFFHAHPDDETIATGGTMAQLADEGHRVVLVLATRGELGEVADGFLAADETLTQRRVAETKAAAEILGVAHVDFLGYRDSGMMGEPTNDDAGAFWSADVEEAAGKLAEILRRERPEVLVIYDDHGGYGHPDHVQVHRVGVRAAELADVDRVYEATMNRDAFRRFREPAEAPTELEDTLGTAESDITHAVDVAPYMDRKKAAMRAHASQIPDDSWFFRMPDEQFTASFGHEWYVRRGAAGRTGDFERSLLA
jgi:LmbE family N-acetylglucosaminyl deacetylase